MSLSNLLTGRRALLLLLLGSAFGFVWGVKAISFTGYAFNPEKYQTRIFISGAEKVSPSEIVTSDLTPLTFLKNDPVRISLNVEKHPQVKDARVVLIPPNRVVIGITERHTSGWTMISGKPWRIDDSGVPFAPFAKTRPVETEILGIRNLVPGTKHPLLTQGISLAIKTKQFRSLSGLHGVRVSGGEASKLPELVFERGAFRVLLGGDKIDEKLIRLASVLKELGTEFAYGNEIDLRFGDWMVFRSVASDI